MASILVVTYDTSSGKYLVQKAGSAQIADGAITSGLLASGIVGTVHLKDGAVTSAKIASGYTIPPEDESITSAKLASGAVIGDRIADVGIFSGKIASGAIGPSTLLANAIITSGKIASGIIGWPHIGSQAIRSGHLGSGQIASGHLVSAIAALVGTVTDGGVTSAKVASGIIAGVHIEDGSILSGEIGSGIIAGIHIKDSSIVSSEIGANAVGGAKIWAYGLVSGKYASGSITEQALASGISIDISEVVQEPSYRAGSLISAYLGVQFSTSGYFNHAQAFDVDTMPTVGLAIASIASGQIGTFQYQGRITNPSWDFSGHIGELLFLGTSSQVTLTAPATSGECVQRVGKVIDPTKVFLRPELAFVQVAE